MPIRPLLHADIPATVALQRACFPPPFPEELLWKAAHLERHLERFPEGQFVAEVDGEVVGSASALIISEANWLAHQDWDATTGGHFFDRHDPAGSTLYGADISVHPDYRGRGLAKALYQARFDLVRRLSLRRYGTACRIPDWLSWSATHPGLSKQVYVDAVARGEALDRTLTPLLRMGLACTGVVEGHMEDEESGNAAAILEWTPGD